MCIAVAVLLSPSGVRAEEQPRSPEGEALSALRRCLGQVAFRRRVAQWGVLVKEMPSGRVLFAHNAELPFNPASNIKLATAAAALEGLGPRYRFTTEVFGQLHRGVAAGLYLRGSGDPSLNTARLAAVVAALKRLGLREVRGPLYLDLTRFEGDNDPPGFRRFHSSHPFRAGVDALSLNHNVVRVAVAPAERPGQRALVNVDPPSAYLKMLGTVRTTGRATRLRVTTHRRNQQTGVLVTGRINLRARPRVFWRRVFHPALYTGHTFLAQLAAAGVRVQPRLGIRQVPAGLDRLWVDRSPDLANLLYSGTKHSSNVVTEHLLLALGAEQYGWPATFAKGHRALGRYLTRFGLSPGTYLLENGSGLSRRSWIRPVDLVRVVEGIYQDFALQPDLLSALPLAGLDGTMRRNRFYRSRVRARLRAKTGTLSGITCLTGYADGTANRLVLFTFLAARVRRPPAARWQQVAMAGCLVDYLDRLAPP